ncbi:MAG TPA: VOC family protein [Candidatus Acidoferrum sp.]|jgi:PhnB protein
MTDSKAVKPIPVEYHTVTPQLTCKDASRAIEFYKNVFGANEVSRFTGPDGKVMHAEIKIGDSRIMINDEFPGMASAPVANSNGSFSLFLYVADVDSVFDKAVKAGSKSLMPVSDQFWGDRFGKVTDPFGHQWGLATHVEDVSKEEMQRRGQEMFSKMSKTAAHA